MQRIIILFLTLLMTTSFACANAIDTAINNSKINKSAVSVSVKNIDTGAIVYERNERKPMIPASTLKIVTYAISQSELGDDYEFTTSLYKTANNDLFLKLGADPFLTSLDLKNLLRTAKAKNIVEPKSIKIDDTVLDNNEWGEGWQWDDDLNSLMPKFSAYNIDKNLIKISVIATQKNAPAEIKTNVFYPTTFMNLVVTSDAGNAVKISRNNSISPDVLTVEGQVANKADIMVPINYPKRYFLFRLEDAVKSAKIDYYQPFLNDKIPSANIYLVDEIKNPIENATKEVMLNSNNLVAETVFKLAGGHFAKSSGSAQNGVLLFKTYCKNNGINSEDVKIVDGSGVSKNNLVTADFMTDFLVKQNKLSKNFMNSFAVAGEGTLKNRMLYFKDNIRAKTGTLSDVSAIAGFITTLSGKIYAFDIMINDAKSSSSDKKMLEEYILRAISTNY